MIDLQKQIDEEYQKQIKLFEKHTPIWVQAVLMDNQEIEVDLKRFATEIVCRKNLI